MDSKPSPRRLSPNIAAAILVLAGLLAYANSFQGVFVFDDAAIIHNPTIRQLWPPGPVLFPGKKEIAQGATVAGRPLLNLSFAVNYAIGGLNPEGYHAVNLLIHLLAGLAFFGIMRRTLMLPLFRSRFEGRENGASLAVALLWLLHPLQTESVTYIVQRAESLAGLFYLLSLYFAVRGLEKNRGGWQAASALACLMAMASKETAVSLPLIILLYDRLFVSESFRDIFKKRRGFYSVLALTWAVLVVLVLMAKGRGGTVGFGHGITSWQYAKVQFQAIFHYLSLSVWPSPLIFDYGTELPAAWWVPYGIGIAGLLAGTFACIRSRLWPGFCGAWFFLILAPSSSVVPVVTQVMAEHRMYLPLAAVVVLAVIGADLAWRKWIRKHGGWEGKKTMQFVPAAAVFTASALLGWCTFARNADYHSALNIWSDTEKKHPESSRAHINVGDQLTALRKLGEAIPHYRQALEIDPDYAEAWCAMAGALGMQGKFAEAIRCNRKAIQIKPKFADPYFNLGAILVAMGKPDKGIEFFEQALAIDPGQTEADFNLGITFVQQDKTAEAERHFRHALQIRPDHAGAHFNLGVLLVSQGKVREGIDHYRCAIQIAPEDAEVYTNLGNAYALLGEVDKAVRNYETGLKLNPNDSYARLNLAKLLDAVGKRGETAGPDPQAAQPRR